MAGDSLQLQGFNNLTKTVNLNLYELFVAGSPEARREQVARLDARYDASRLSGILHEVARIIDAEVLSVSTQKYDPHGASALALMSDLGQEAPHAAPDAEVEYRGHGSVGAHLTKSHLCAHTYPDWLDPEGVCAFRLDIDIATCGTIVPLRALDHLLEHFDADVVFVDYAVRGFTRDTQGRRVYLDHNLESISDFVDPRLLARYELREGNDASLRHWRTRFLRRELAGPNSAASPPTKGEIGLAASARELFELR